MIQWQLRFKWMFTFRCFANKIAEGIILTRNEAKVFSTGLTSNLCNSRYAIVMDSVGLFLYLKGG